MRLGIYGGTFSPPHNGHFLAAKSFAEEMELDRLLIIPTYIPPHKSMSDDTTAEQRLQMCAIAFSELEIAEISDIEIKRRGKSYTYLTLEELSRDGVELYLLCGTDMFLTLDTWANFERIFNLATICCARREEDAENDALIESKLQEYKTKYNARAAILSHKALEVSSTDVRGCINGGKNSVQLIDGRVLEYIRERGLYK